MINRGVKPNGKADLVFATTVSSNLGLSTDELKRRYRDKLVPVPCGKCIGCRLDNSKQWAVRCVLESLDHECNSFITLTYDEHHVPSKLIKSHLSGFIKRLRATHPEITIRFFGCGEYGSLNGRPHYHAILFGYDFPDKELFSGDGDSALYRSKELEKLWTFGISSIGKVSLESCAYVARYSMKKTTGCHGDEFLLMSRRPGLAANWFLDHQEMIYLSDHVYGAFGKSHSASVPRYFDKLAEKSNIDLTDVKSDRIRRANDFELLFKKLHQNGISEEINKLTESLLLNRIKSLRRYL